MRRAPASHHTASCDPPPPPPPPPLSNLLPSDEKLQHDSAQLSANQRTAHLSDGAGPVITGPVAVVTRAVIYSLKTCSQKTPVMASSLTQQKTPVMASSLTRQKTPVMASSLTRQKNVQMFLRLVPVVRSLFTGSRSLPVVFLVIDSSD
ncbi:uncharacterized protein V6R79_020209 [Siganus canaliculatus]